MDRFRLGINISSFALKVDFACFGRHILRREYMQRIPKNVAAGQIADTHYMPRIFQKRMTEGDIDLRRLYRCGRAVTALPLVCDSERGSHKNLTLERNRLRALPASKDLHPRHFRPDGLLRCRSLLCVGDRRYQAARRDERDNGEQEECCIIFLHGGCFSSTPVQVQNCCRDGFHNGIMWRLL